jgi:hypothetical protein
MQPQSHFPKGEQMNTPDNERTSVYERITQQIIHAIESGTAQYQMPWQSGDADSPLPVNAVTRKPYRGVLLDDSARTAYIARRLSKAFEHPLTSPGSSGLARPS